MDVIDSTSLNNLGSARGGCNNSGQAPTGSGLVVLAFGQAWTIGSVQGVKIYAPNLPFYTISQVETAMRSFIGGYVGCVKALPGISLTVAVGLNNSGNTTAMSSAHGTAWAGMINNLRSYINDHLPETVVINGQTQQVTWASKIRVIAGVDFEPLFGQMDRARNWLAGYDTIDQDMALNFGTCDSCPNTAYQGNQNVQLTSIWSSNWTTDDIWFVSYGASPSYALPEIYNTLSYNAQQWANLSKYAATCASPCAPFARRGSIPFQGAMTQKQACLDNDATGLNICDATVRNAPTDGWTQLTAELVKVGFSTPHLHAMAHRHRENEIVRRCDMSNKNRFATTLLPLAIGSLAILALVSLLLSQGKASTPLSQSQAGYPGPGTAVGPKQGSTPALPNESTAWWKQTEVASMATLSAAATPIAQFVDVPMDPTPIQLLQRSAGDGRIVVQASPWWLDHFLATSAWVSKTPDKYVVVYVGLYLTTTSSEMQVIVEWDSLKDFSRLEGGGVYPAPIQDTSLAIVDAIGHTLILHAASGETVWFDAEAQSFVPSVTGKSSERAIGAGKVVEESKVDFAMAGARVFDVWTAPMKATTLEVFAGEVKEAGAASLSFGKGAVFIREVDPANVAKALPVAIEAPDSVGALRVFAMVDDKLVLVDANGVAFVFDIQARKFLPPDSVKLPQGTFFGGMP